MNYFLLVKTNIHISKFFHKLEYFCFCYKGLLWRCENTDRKRARRCRKRIQGGHEHPEQRQVWNGGRPVRHDEDLHEEGHGIRDNEGAVRPAHWQVWRHTGKARADGHAAVRHGIHGVHDFRQHGQRIAALPSRSCNF